MWILQRNWKNKTMKTPIELVEKWRTHSQKLNDALLESTSRAYRTCANELEAALAEQWISVEERLPEYDGLVFARHVSGNISVPRFILAEQWWNFGRHTNFDPVTHWMPIPPLPNKKS